MSAPEAVGPYRPLSLDPENGRVFLVCAGCHTGHLAARVGSAAGETFHAFGAVALCLQCRGTVASAVKHPNLPHADELRRGALEIMERCQLAQGEAVGHPHDWTALARLVAKERDDGRAAGFRHARSIVQEEADRYQGDDLYGAALRDLLERMDEDAEGDR